MKFTEEQGLKTAEVSCIAQNNESILYLGTMNGIASYNSSIFRHYKERDSNASNYVIKIEDGRNKIYFSTMSGLFSFDGHKYHTIDTQQRISAIRYDAKNQLLYYCTKNKLFAYQTNIINSTPKVLGHIPETDITIVHHITSHYKKAVYLSTNKGLYYYQPNHNIIQLNNTTSFYNFIDFKGELINITHITIDRYNSNNNLINSFQYREDLSKKYNIKNIYLKIFASHNDNTVFIYAPTLSHNYIEFDNKALSDALKQSSNIYKINIGQPSPKLDLIELPKDIRNPSGTQATHNGNLWVSTLEGLYLLKTAISDDLYKIIPSVSPIGAISLVNNKICYVNRASGFYSLTNENKVDSISLRPLTLSVEKNLAGTVYAMQSDTNGNILATTLKKGIAIQKKDGKVIYLEETLNTSLICMSKDNYGNIYIAGTGGIFCWNGKLLQKMQVDKELEESFIFSILPHKKELFIASSSGIYHYKDNKTKNISKELGLNNITYSSLCIDAKNRIIVGTFGKGVYIIENKNEKYQISNTWNMDNGLSSNSINSIVRDKSNRIWIGSSKNIQLLIEKNSMYSIYNFESNTLVENNYWGELNLFIDSSNNLFIGGKNGVIHFDCSKFNIDTAIQESTMIDNIKIDNHYINPTQYNIQPQINGIPQNIKFSYLDRNITFEYTAINYTQNNIQYQYMLEGLENKWASPTLEKSVSYRNLESGTYTFRVRHGYNNTWSSPSSFTFTIQTPWWKSRLFYLFLFILFGISIFLILKTYIKKNAEKHKKELYETEIRHKILLLRGASLLNQMKPHFVFNALAPLQNFIYKSDQKKAIEYLNTISTLLRNMLNHSRYTEVTIADEVIFLNQYLTQQQIEKNYSFQYTLTCEIMNQNLKIPCLMIQPLIENCIQHGLSTKGIGTIQIHMQLTNNHTLEVSIQENGDGFDLEKEMNSKNNSALNILRDRVELLNQKNKSKLSNISSCFLHNKFIITLQLPISE